jgi:hypothetical protein
MEAIFEEEGLQEHEARFLSRQTMLTWAKWLMELHKGKQVQ